jgi:hypothetical protein
MGDWLHHIALSVKARTGFGPALAVWFVTAAISLVVALVFLCVAAFVWLANRYDGAIAGLLLGVFFFLLAIITGFAGWSTRLRNRERGRLELAQLGLTARSQANLLDPRVLALGLAQDLYGQTADAARDTAANLETQPYAAAIVALGIGWLLGRMHRPLRVVSPSVLGNIASRVGLGKSAVSTAIAYALPKLIGALTTGGKIAADVSSEIQSRPIVPRTTEHFGQRTTPGGPSEQVAPRYIEVIHDKPHLTRWLRPLLGALAILGLGADRHPTDRNSAIRAQQRQ